MNLQKSFVGFIHPKDRLHFRQLKDSDKDFLCRSIRNSLTALSQSFCYPYRHQDYQWEARKWEMIERVFRNIELNTLDDHDQLEKLLYPVIEEVNKQHYKTPSRSELMGQKAKTP